MSYLTAPRFQDHENELRSTARRSVRRPRAAGTRSNGRRPKRAFNHWKRPAALPIRGANNMSMKKTLIGLGLVAASGV